jgi:hypothetical protein
MENGGKKNLVFETQVEEVMEHAIDRLPVLINVSVGNILLFSTIYSYLLQGKFATENDEIYISWSYGN